MVSSCIVFGCNSSRYNKKRSFFRFPLDKIRCRQWVDASGRKELAQRSEIDLHRSYLICDLHFEASNKLGVHGNRLRYNAIPTLRLPQEGEELSSLNKYTQTPTNTAELKLENVTQITPQRLQSFIDFQEQLQPYTRRKKFTKGFMLLALNVFFAGPHAYRVLSKLMRLPDERQLRRIKVNTGTKLSPEVLKCLKLKIQNLEDLDKYCVISAGDIKLKSHLYYQINKDYAVGFHEIDGIQSIEPATRAVVLMAQGIYKNWEQPLCYSFLAQNPSHDELNTWIDNIISKAMDIGFKVVAFVTDQTFHFWNLASERGITLAKPYFFINGQKIYYIFDVPQILTSLRNNLIKYDIKCQEANGTEFVARWSDIKMVHALDSKRDHQLAPELTKSHVDPSSPEKREVRYATQVFSKSLAAAMICFIELGQIDDHCIGTVHLIEMVSNALEVLNLSDVTELKMKKKFKGLPKNYEVLNKFLRFLSGVTFHDTENHKQLIHSVKCIEGFKISLTSIMSLQKDLEAQGLKFLFIQKLGQTALKHFLCSVIQQSNNKCRSPTPIAFTRAFSKLFMINLINTDCKLRKYERDLDSLLTSADDLVAIYKSEHDRALQSDAAAENPTLTVGRSDYIFNVPEHGGLHYVCNYLLKACNDIHKCNNRLDAYLKTSEEMAMEIENEQMGPPDAFVNFVKALDKCVKKVFKNKIIRGRIGNEILTAQSDLNFVYLCTCFPTDYLKKLFVRFRIYDILRSNNQLLKENPLDVVKYVRIPSL